MPLPDETKIHNSPNIQRLGSTRIAGSMKHHFKRNFPMDDNSLPLDPSSKTLSGPLAKLLTRLNALRRVVEPKEPSRALTTVPNRALDLPKHMPATEAEIITHLTMLDVVFPSRQMTQADRVMRLKVFCSDLVGYPESVIGTACKCYRRDSRSKGFPFPGELIALCEEEMRALRPKLKLVPIAPVYPPHPQPLKLLGLRDQEPETSAAETLRETWAEIDATRSQIPEDNRAYLERVRAIHGPRNELLSSKE